MTRRLVLAAALLAAVTAAAVAVLLVAPWRSGHASLSRPDLQRVLDRLVAEKNVAPGAVAAVITPKGTWVGAAGVADLATGRPATPDDYARIASLTKTYTATLILQLVAEHKLGLGDTVGQRLPGVLPADKAKITIRQLLSHSSGLYDTINDAWHMLDRDPAAFYASLHDPAFAARFRAVVQAIGKNPELRMSPKLWVEVAAREPLYFRPGEGNHYSSTNYVLLGWIVERTTHVPLGTAMKQRIFEPLGLAHSVYDPGPDLPSPYLHGYVLPAGEDGTPADISRVTLGIAGASAVVATAEDVARFYEALLAGRLLPNRLLEDVMLPEQMRIGAYPTPCGSAHGHDGAWQGYLSYARVTDDGTAAVLLLDGQGPESSQRGESAAADLICGA
ncbi:MAG: serine hydrolase domain-containing protein [Gaiellaceae bacterium]